MDFKDIINKVAELNDEVEYVKAPELEKAPQLNEDQELRVLAGLKTLTESAVKEIAEETEEILTEGDVSDIKVGQKKKSATGGTLEKTATGYKHHGKKYGGSADDEEKDDDMDEAVESEEEVVDEASEAQKKAREKFMAMVKGKKEDKKEESVKEAKKAKPDYLDFDKDGDKKEPMKKALKDKKEVKTDEAMCKSKKKMKEADYSAKKAAAGKDIGKPGKQFAKIAKKAGEKYGSKERGEKVAGAVLKKLRAKESVNESAQDVLSFREMAKLVRESGGQQRIDATDTALWTWAKRVAANKFEDNTRQEVYAGLVYERMGGHFDMVDVLAEQNND